MTGLNDNIHVIIRSVGERTTEATHQILTNNGLLQTNIDVITELSLKQSLRKSLELAKSRNKPWLFLMDADLLLFNESINMIHQLTCKAPKNTFCIKFHALDKFLGVHREIGNVCFRAEMIPKALKYIPQITEETPRPTARLISMTLEEEGDDRQSAIIVSKSFKHAEPTSASSKKIVIGVYGAEQFYKDIYRKHFRRGHKHLHYASDFLVFFKRRIKEDLDFKVALKGFLDGVLFLKNYPVDKEEISEEKINSIFKKMEIKEKPPINALEKLDAKSIYEKLKHNCFYLHHHHEKIDLSI